MEKNKKHLYIGEWADHLMFTGFYAKSKSEAIKIAKGMGLKAFGRLTHITVLTPTKETTKA